MVSRVATNMSNASVNVAQNAALSIRTAACHRVGRHRSFSMSDLGRVKQNSAEPSALSSNESLSAVHGSSHTSMLTSITVRSVQPNARAYDAVLEKLVSRLWTLPPTVP